MNAWSLGLGLLALLLLGPVVVLFILCWKEIQAHWDLRLFLSEYLKTLGYVLPVVVGFVLLNLFWERQVEVERARGATRIFAQYVGQMGDLLRKARDWLERRTTSEREAEQRVEQVRRFLDQAVWMSQGLQMLHAMAMAAVKDHQAMDSLTGFCFRILPRVNALRDVTDLRPGNYDLRQELEFLAKEIEEWLKGAEHGLPKSRAVGRSPG